MSIRDIVELWQLGRRRLRSEEDYRRFQSLQSALVLRYLWCFGLDIKGQLVLDLGSGIAGYSVEMLREGARVISLDLMRPSLGLTEGHGHIVANALSIPLRDEAVDLVFCASLIEHVSDPALLLAAICRVLKRGGYCYLSFPPFYSFRGGHEFSPFHYLGERCAIWLARHRGKPPEWVSTLHKASPNPRSFAETYRGWGLHTVTIAKVRNLVATTGLETVDISTRYFPIGTARWPVLGEVLTWHAQFLLRKPRCCV